MPKMPKKSKSKIKRCIILNPPQTPEEQESFNRRYARALAQALYRSLSPEEYDQLIQQLKQRQRERNDAAQV